jgi:hydroxycarboxylate dehydrogenase B
MASGASGVGEVRVMPDPLHAFTMAICRADGSSAEEARLVADHLVLANLFGHDSHGVGMMPAYIQNTTKRDIVSLTNMQRSFGTMARLS